MRYRAAASSEVGRVRRRNEDSYVVHEPLFAVADGMGGHRGGDVASSMTIETLDGATFEGAHGFDALVAAIRTANGAVLERGDADKDLAGMGTTVTALLLEDARGHIAHVGDSRAYLFRDGALQQLTEDHTLVQQMVRQGRLDPADAERHPQRSILTRALGVDDQVRIDELTFDVHDRDRILLCSDGLSGMLADAAIELALASEPDPQAACDRLVEEANLAGGEDNITVIVVEVTDDAAADADAATIVSGEDAPTDDAMLTAEVPVVAVTDDPTVIAGDAPEASDVAPLPSDAPRSRRGLKVVLSVVLVLAVAGAALLGVRAYLSRQWYVGASNGHVAIFNGIPASFAGVHLSHVDSETPLPAAEVERIATWKGLTDGITARSRTDAEAIVDAMRQALCDAGSSACVEGVG